MENENTVHGKKVIECLWLVYLISSTPTEMNENSQNKKGVGNEGKHPKFGHLLPHILKSSWLWKAYS